MFSWTGFYVGVHAGYAFGSTSFRVNETPPRTASTSPDGFVGGTLVGFNYQINQAVVGLEADFGLSSISGSGIAGGALNTHNNSFKQDWDGHLRARLGYNGGNFMPFIAGGFSFGNDKLTVSSAGVSASASKSLSGWNIGGGVDYAFNNNWVGRIEYIYDQFNAMTYAVGGGFNTRSTGRPNVSTIRAGVYYTFGGGASTVVAKY